MALGVPGLYGRNATTFPLYLVNSTNGATVPATSASESPASSETFALYGAGGPLTGGKKIIDLTPGFNVSAKTL
jgi:hypothetical protein